jgi:SAM-dependent methyltransferase
VSTPIEAREILSPRAPPSNNGFEGIVSEIDKVFTGSIPKLYDAYLVPLIFEPYAADLGGRLARRPAGRVLEIAAGTGVVTRRLASVLPGDASIVATDLNQSMLDLASAVGTPRPVEWRQADAMQLPFGDETFDAVVCQFGAMFFPDKAKAFSEARRVLRPGGIFIFNVWDRIEENEFADIVTAALEPLFPQDPPRFLARTPHGYHDRSMIERDLERGGFTAPPGFSTVAARSRAASPRVPAIAYCQGTPLRSEIEARDAARLAEATDIAAQAIARRFGPGAVDGKIQAHVVTVES